MYRMTTFYWKVIDRHRRHAPWTLIYCPHRGHYIIRQHQSGKLVVTTRPLHGGWPYPDYKEVGSHWEGDRGR